MAGACQPTAENRDENDRARAAHQRAARGSRLARRADAPATVALTLSSPD